MYRRRNRTRTCPSQALAHYAMSSKHAGKFTSTSLTAGQILELLISRSICDVLKFDTPIDLAKPRSLASSIPAQVSR